MKDLNKEAKEKDDKIEDYHVEEAYRHLIEAEKVKKNPKLLERVKAHAKIHEEAMSGIQELGEKPAKSTKELREKAQKMGA